MATSRIGEMMSAYAQDAEEWAQKVLGIKLDYSEESIEIVEKQILARYHDDLARSKPSEERVWGVAKAWGGYIGEVARRKWGGEWTDSTGAFPGERVLTLRVGTVDHFIPNKVAKRIVNGPEDNVWDYYRLSFYSPPNLPSNKIDP